MLAVALPRFDVRGIDVVEPPAPVVPRNEDADLRPQPAFDDGVHLSHRPLHAVRDVPDQRLAAILGIGRVFAGVVRRVDPRHGGEGAGACVADKLVGGRLVLLAQSGDEAEGVAPVVPPRQVGLHQICGQRRELKHRSPRPAPVPGRVLDHRGVRGDQHQMVGRGRPGHIGEIVVAQRELSRVGKVRRDVLFGKLQPGGGLFSR